MRKLTFFILVAAMLVGAALLLAERKISSWQEEVKAEFGQKIVTWEKEKETLSRLPREVAALDELIQKGEYEKALSHLDDLESQVSPNDVAAFSDLLHRRAEVHYRRCDEHIRFFLFAYKAGFFERAGQERDGAGRECDAAGKVLTRASVLIGPEKIPSRFFIEYGMGNVSVRQAMLAISADTQAEAMARAVGSYISALEIKDDYETKVNLELLLDTAKSLLSQGRGKRKPISPDQFKLQPGDGDGAYSVKYPKSNL